MQIYIIYTEIHQWEYTWRLTKYDFKQPDFEPHAVEINSRKPHTAQRELNYINAPTSSNSCEWNEISITENPDQIMRISGLYAKPLNLYMTCRNIIYRHIFIKVKR